MLINIKHYKNVPNNYDAFKERINAKIGQDATARKCIKTYAFVFTRPKLQISRKKNLLFKLLRHCQGWATILEREEKTQK